MHEFTEILGRKVRGSVDIIIIYSVISSSSSSVDRKKHL